MTKIFKSAMLGNEFIRYWIENGFEQSKPLPVIPPQNWSDTLFVNSGLIGYLEILNKKGEMPCSLVTCQPCIKLGSVKFSLEEMMTKDGYFTFFEQLSCGGNHTVSIPWFTEKAWRYLTRVLHFLPEKVYIGVSSSQPFLRDCWIDSGVKIENITFPDPHAFILNLRDGKIHGTYSSLYYDRGKNHPLACKKVNCDINCSCDRFLEIGDVGIIKSYGKTIIDHGIGLERITAVKEGSVRVTDIEQLSEILEFLKNELELEYPYLLKMLDHARSAVVLLASGLKPGNKKKEYVLRNLIRQTFLLLFKAGDLREEKINNIYGLISKNLDDYLPYFKISQEAVITEILKEFKKYQDLITRGEKVLQSFKGSGNRKELSRKDIEFLYNTYGLPPDIVNTLLTKDP